MIRSITIKNLRGIREGELRDLTELVVLVGPNSSGKSTVLDALLLAASPSPLDSLLRVVNRRPEFQQGIQWLLYRDGGRESATAEIVIQSNAAKARMATVTHPKGSASDALGISTLDVNGMAGQGRVPVPPRPPVISKGGLQGPTSITPLEDVPEINIVEPVNSKRSLADLYTLVAERGLTNQAKSIVTDLLPDVRGIEILSQRGQPVVYVVYKSGAQPLAVAGDGVRLLLQQSLELAAPVGGVVLLEEPEAHMHPGAIRQSARAMLAAVARGIQVILTTHSLELIDSLLAEAKTEDLNKLSIYRLQLHDGKLKSHRLSGAEASRARTQIEDDLR